LQVKIGFTKRKKERENKGKEKTREKRKGMWNYLLGIAIKPWASLQQNQIARS
jgi:hypothetical protein